MDLIPGLYLGEERFHYLCRQGDEQPEDSVFVDETPGFLEEDYVLADIDDLREIDDFDVLLNGDPVNIGMKNILNNRLVNQPVLPIFKMDLKMQIQILVHLRLQQEHVLPRQEQQLLIHRLVNQDVLVQFVLDPMSRRLEYPHQLLPRVINGLVDVGQLLVEVDPEEVRNAFPAEFSELLTDHFCHFLAHLRGEVISLVVLADVVVDGVDDEVVLPLELLHGLLVPVHVHEVVDDHHVFVADVAVFLLVVLVLGNEE